MCDRVRYSFPSLQVENILLSSEGSAKLCDFGSAALAPPDATGAPTSADVLRLADEVGRLLPQCREGRALQRTRTYS